MLIYIVARFARIVNKQCGNSARFARCNHKDDKMYVVHFMDHVANLDGYPIKAPDDEAFKGAPSSSAFKIPAHVLSSEIDGGSDAT